MKLSLRSAAVLAILFGLLLPACLGGYLSIKRESQRIEADLANDQRRAADILALGMQEPLWNLSPDAGKPLLDSLMSDRRIVRVIVTDASLGTFLSLNRPERRQGHLHTVSRQVNKQGNVIGTVTVEMDDGQNTAYIQSLYRQYFTTVASQTAISLLLTLLLLYSRVLRPLEMLLDQSGRLSRNELDTPFSWPRDDELGTLGQNLEKTRNAIKEYQGMLEQKSLQLETDLLSRRQVEAALRAGQERYRCLVEDTPFIPWEAAPSEWRFTYVGPQSEALLGYPPSVWYSDNFLPSYLHPDDRHLAYQLFSNIQCSQTQFECRLLARDGREVWVLLSSRAQISEHEQSRLHGFMIDITERKQHELELEKYRARLEEVVDSRTRDLAVANHELESFSYSVSHDLRTPLRAIEGYSQVLQDDYSNQLDSNGRHYLQRIRSATSSMLELIDDILNLYKLSRAELRRQSVNLSTMAQDLAEELNALQQERQVEVEIAPDLYANADPKQIRIVLYNLLDNAWKFTLYAQPSKVRFGSTEVNGQLVYFVSDNGIGFDMKDSNKLFSPFQRLHSAAEFQDSGNGIGLAIVQRIINRHDGHVWAKSALNEGATFYFTLPVPKKTD
ncbi:PAS domain S-box-containing protein [Formivibrio citricus]|uniref:histidine kinase n=1 Tax=Formivibrio citricus TaxID=83765 RepID=A0A1I5BX86_9NEIS|nr:ATP-binding protein [Formivibrio citricus]SFN79202.1 PAS domain S-box-containing protein [Formivibrio citricus]